MWETEEKLDSYFTKYTKTTTDGLRIYVSKVKL